MTNFQIGLLVALIIIAFVLYSFIGLIEKVRKDAESAVIRKIANEMQGNSYWLTENYDSYQAISIYAKTLLSHGWVDASKHRDEWRISVKKRKDEKEPLG